MFGLVEINPMINFKFPKLSTLHIYVYETKNVVIYTKVYMKKVNKLLWLGGHIVVFVVCDIDLLLACNIHNGCQFQIDFCIWFRIEETLIIEG